MGDWLDARALHNVLDYLLILIQSQLALLLMLVPVDPDQTGLAFLDYVHLVVCPEFDPVLLQVELTLNVYALVVALVSFVELVCETGTQTFVHVGR